MDHLDIKTKENKDTSRRFPMGCRHSSLRNSNEIKKKSCLSKKTSSIKETAFHLERVLNGHGEHLIERIQLDSACLTFDLSSTHILLFENRSLQLIEIKTMKIQKQILPFDIEDIVWTSFYNSFLLITTDRLYRTNLDQLNLIPIDQIQFTKEGQRKSFMTVHGDDLLINRSFGHDLRHYSLSKCRLMRLFRVYKDAPEIIITTIRLNSKKILAMAITFAEKQMIDLFHLYTNQFLHRISLDHNEQIFYPIDLHSHGQWFAKTSIPNVNIGHCLVSSDGFMIRLKLFSNQDNFIRSFKISEDQKWLLVGRQYLLELYSFY